MATAGVTVRVEEGVRRRTDLLLLAAIAALIAMAHLLTNSRYGFHRDELQFLSDARHLEWGFVAYPPLTPFVERISMAVFGLNLVGLRLASVLAQAAAIVATGLMARELGGRRLAQCVAAVCVALSPLPMFEGTEFQYTTFDYLWWVLLALCVIRLLRTENRQWWLAIGVLAGVGLMTKYAILFYIAGILGGFLLTRARRHMASWYFGGTLVLTVLICLPNLLWQAHHHFISYAFLQHIHKRDVGEGRAHGFVRQQFWLCANLFAAPVWIAGLVAFLLSARYRVLAWMYLIPVGIFALSHGRGYYTAGLYPMLLAMGAVAGERWIAPMKAGLRRTLEIVFFTGVGFVGAHMAAVILPIASSGPLMRFALGHNGDLREEIGWDELVRTVANIRDSLPPEQQAHLGILVGNYGEQGAIEMLGPAYHLPAPISGTNSAWLRGYPSSPPSTLIVLGLSERYADKTLQNCRLAGHNGNSYGVENEESRDHQDIFVCSGPRQPWPDFWNDFQDFG
jgi:hypothetical protein